MKVKTTGDKLPHAWVASPNDKGRRKIYKENKIYLNNGEEFAIELYNPTQNNVVALINLDGKPISSSGLVVRAGERFYLDCFMDDNRKFVFDTYEVENTEESNDAISKNGLLEVYFYNEKITERVDLTNIETGQTIKGDESNQKFKEIDMTFEEEHVSNVTYMLLPESRMPKTSKDVSRASMERISDRLAEGEYITDLFNRLYTFHDLERNKLIEKDEFDLIKSKTVKSMIGLSSNMEIESIDDLPHYISNLGDLMNTGLITEDEFKTIKSNLFNSIK